MHPIFSITTKDIQNLTDEQSRELIARLCRVEVRKHGASEEAVSWGGDQRAKDGGVDVRVDIDPPAGIGGYIKNDRCAFQVKAENFSAGKIAGEMAPKGVLRPAIVDLAKSSGAYVIASTRDSLSDSALSDRVEAMTNCLSDHGLAGKVIVDFYDCRKIGDWIEQQPAIADWVKFVLGKPLVGWRPYGPWAYQETDVDAEYLVDKRVKVFVPNADEGCEILSAINSLRADLSKNVAIRIVGLSGVGKTRLVQALLDKRIVTASPVLDTDNVLYTDLSDNPTPQPNAMVEALRSEEADCIVVVDNCGPDVHRRLTEIAKGSGSKIRLVTIEYDIRDDLPEGTVCYRLEGSSDDVIKELLKRRFKFLSDNDLDKIAEFSDGNARVAYALASTTETTGELARLRDSELFKRLFVQKNTESDELLRCAEAASLLYSFDGEDISSHSEMAALSSLAEVSILTFSRNVAELRRRGLLQERGKWRAVLPHAISNRLAAQAIEAIPRAVVLHALVEAASDRTARSFSRRLGYLHESRTAREIVREWLKPSGRFGDLANLNEIGRQIFANIAPVDEEATLEALDHASLNPDFVSMDSDAPSHFARIARSLAYEPALFGRAVNVLLRFALAEPEGHRYESTRDMLKSLFYSHLSGTEAQSEQRSKVVRELVLSDDRGRQKLGLLLLDAALEAWHFSSTHGFDFGARKRGYGWWPRTRDDVHAWYAPFVEIAVEAGKNNDERGREARIALGEAVRGLWVRADLRDEISGAADELAAIGGWPEGWLGTRRILLWDRKEISEGSLQELRKLERALAPRDLRAKIGAKVLARGSFGDDVDEDDDEAETASSRHHRAGDEAEDLGKAAALEGEILTELLPELLRSNSNSKAWNFGFGVGQEYKHAQNLLAQVREILATAQLGTVSLIFLRGFISGWHKKEPEEVSAFLDGALHDEVWVKWFPKLQLRIDLDEIGFRRLIKSLELGQTPIWQYRYLGMGRVTDPLTVDQILALVSAIASKPEGLEVAIDILAMVVHCTDEKDENYCRDLAAACISFLRTMDWSQIGKERNGTDHDIDVILEFALRASKSETEISDILNNIVGRERWVRRSYSSRGRLLAPFFRHFPKQTLDAVYMPDEDGSYRSASRLVVGASRRRETAIGNVPDDALIEWCETSPQDRYAFAAETCTLFKKAESDPEGDHALELSDVSKRVLAGARDKTAVLRIFIERFRPMSWSGSLSATLARRLPLLAQLNLTGDATLKNEIARAEESLKNWIAVEQAQEEAEERERTGSFE